MVKDDLDFEDWKKEPEKYELIKKYHKVSDIIGACYYNPTQNNVRRAYGAVMDYLMSIPVAGDSKRSQQQLNDLIHRADKVGKVLDGNPKNPEVQKLMNEFNVYTKLVKISNVKLVPKLQNLQNLVRELRDILRDAGMFATTVGLRVTLHRKKKHGWRKLVSEEGFDQ